MEMEEKEKKQEARRHARTRWSAGVTLKRRKEEDHAALMGSEKKAKNDYYILPVPDCN